MPAPVREQREQTAQGAAVDRVAAASLKKKPTAPSAGTVVTGLISI